MKNIIKIILSGLLIIYAFWEINLHFIPFVYAEVIETKEVRHGNSVLARITVKDRNADPRDLTGFTVNFRLCASEDDYVTVTYVITPVPTFTNLAQSGDTLGQAFVQLTKANMTQTPGTYFLYLDITNGSGAFLWTSNKYILEILN